MNATTQTVEAAFGQPGRLVLTFNSPGPAVEHAGSAGMEDGQRVVRNALTSAVGPDLQRAKELFAVVQAADRVLAQHEAEMAAIDRKQAAAFGLLFGSALDARLLELAKEREAAADQRVAALGDHADALGDLKAIRDRAVSDGVKTVANAVAERRKAAVVERQQTAARLVEAVEGLLVKMLALDGELGELGLAKADDAVLGHLEAVLPDVFAASGLAPAEPYDWRAEKAEREAERRRRGWDDISYPAVPAWVGGSDEREDD